MRIAVTKSLISISLRDKLKIKKNLQLKLVNYNRIKPEHKNLKYKFILKSHFESYFETYFETNFESYLKGI